MFGIELLNFLLDYPKITSSQEWVLTTRGLRQSQSITILNFTSFVKTHSLDFEAIYQKRM